MEFLKEILGDELYRQSEARITSYNQSKDHKGERVKLANLSTGDYVGKGKYERLVQEKNRMKRQVGSLNSTIDSLKEDMMNTKRTYTLKEQLRKNGVLDPDYLIFKAGGMEQFSFDEENEPIGIEKFLKSYKAEKTLSYLFEREYPSCCAIQNLPH